MHVEAEIKAVALMQPEEQKQFTEWVWNRRELNMFDPSVIGYPRATMLKASKDGGAILYIPLQPVLMYDAVAAKPEITESEKTDSMLKIGELIDSVQKDLGYAEAYFLCRDDQIAELCLKNGFEELKDVRILRHKAEMPKANA